ncbi:MAG: transglutaminase domain-containing protein [Actinomycetales bacterium]|nr:transglutaminase domain-containing protein [Actinomycetales bacterium]
MSPRSRTGIGVSAALYALALALAAAAWWPVYESAAMVVAGAVAIVLGSALALLGAGLRWPSFVVLLAGVALFLLVGVPVAVPGETASRVLPTLPGLLDLVAGVALGWKQLLTVTLPVGSYQALLVPFFASVYVAALLGQSLARRVRLGGLAILLPGAVFVLGILVGPEGPSELPYLGLAVLAASLLWLMHRRGRRRRDELEALARAVAKDGERLVLPAAVARGVAGGLVLLALAAAGSGVAAAAVPPSGPRDVLRASVEQPFDPRDYPSPLAGLRAYLREDQVDAAQFTIDGMLPGARVRIATLDSYDGVVYAVGSAAVDSASGTFVRIPSRVDQSDEPGVDALMTVSISGYRGVWVPTVGRFESVRFTGPRADALTDGFVYNDTSGTAADLATLASGDSYVLRARVPTDYDTSILAAATPGSAPVPRIETLPDGLAAQLDEWTQGISDPGARLTAALEALRSTGYISHGLSADEPPSRSGHGADRIAELFSGTRMIGDAEQYSVAAALMARQLGFPARVVFGFANDAPVVDAVTFTGADVTAWIEVDTAQNGWVAVDPVPEERPIPDEEPDDATQIARPQTIVPPPNDDDTKIDSRLTPESTPDDRDTPNALLLTLLAVGRGVGIGLLVLAVALTPFLLVVIAKARRRRLRRRAPDPLQRLRGGWDEFTDTALDHGFEPPPAATRAEWASTVGSLPAGVLAAVADRAVFAPETTGPVDADRVWEAVDELSVAMDAGRSRWERLRARISLRSLGGYSVRKLFTREAVS